MGSSLDAIFNPRGIAVIGASAVPGKMGYDIFKNVLEAGFSGKIVPVNPKGEVILGCQSVKSVSELPDGIDLAVVIIPSRFVPDTIAQCGQKGIKGAVVITGGFSETGDEGAKLQKELSDAAKKYGVRVVGPNCQGVNYPYNGVCGSWPLITLKGGMAIISQSGTVGAALIDWASEEKLGFSAFVSMGNRADVDESDLIEYFAKDPNSKVITLYIEGVKNADKFLSAVKKCKKPIIILKAGRTEKGRKAAESHTKSLAGKDEVYEGIFRQYRIYRADNAEELYDFSKAFAYLKPPKGNKMVIITSSGGAAILATDVAEVEGVNVSELPKKLKEKLSTLLPSHCIIGNPLDLTGDGGYERYRSAIEAVEKDYDIVAVIFGDPIDKANEVIKKNSNHFVIYFGGADVERREKILMHKKGIPVFPTPERGIKALSQFFKFRR